MRSEAQDGSNDEKGQRRHRSQRGTQPFANTCKPVMKARKAFGMNSMPKSPAKPPAGLGRKRPLKNIAIGRLHLDPANPRLPEEAQGSKKDELLPHLFAHFDLEEIAAPMAQNGYFDEEPLVAVPVGLPKKLQPDPGEPASAEYLKFLDKAEFTVVEGKPPTGDSAKFCGSPPRARSYACGGGRKSPVQCGATLMNTGDYLSDSQRGSPVPGRSAHRRQQEMRQLCQGPLHRGNAR
jgi:hypothetical protein